MSKKQIQYDIKLVDSLYRSGNDILIRIAKRNLESNKLEFEEYLESVVKSNELQSNTELFSELRNIDWIFLNSIFLTLFSNFENLISILAQIVSNESQSMIGIEDIKGKGYIDQYRKYMYLIGKIKSAEKNDLWDELDIYKLVRNKLAHENGNLINSLNTRLESKKEFKYLIENKVSIAGLLGNIRIRETHFLERFCTLTNGLLNDLICEIEETSRS